MDLEYASDSELEIFSKMFEKLNIPKCNLKIEENPMIEATNNPVETAAMDIPESSNTTRFTPRYSRTPTARGTTKCSCFSKTRIRLTNGSIETIRYKSLWNILRFGL